MITTTERSRFVILALAVVAFFMDGIDGSIITIALPQITESFNAGVNIASWVVLIYFLVICSFILIVGKIIEKTGASQIFLVGFAIFTVGSLLCALADSIFLLIVFRALQGAGACCLAAASPALIALYLPSKKRGVSFGILAASSAVAFAIGPVIGGAILEVTTWHWIFLINIPIGISAVIAGYIILPREKPELRSLSFDYLGALLIFLTTILLFLFITSGIIAGLPVALTLCVAALVSAAALVIWERRTDDPVLDMDLITRRPFFLSTLAFVFLGGAFGGILFILPFYFDVILHATPGITGMYLLIPAVFCAICNPPAGATADRYGTRIVTIIGGSLVTLSFFLFCGYTTTEETILIFGSLILIGVGSGIFQGPGASRIIENSPEEKKVIASAILSMALYIGVACGTALFSAAFSWFVPTGEHATIHGAIFMQGFHAAMITGLVMAGIGLILTIAVRNHSPQKKYDTNSSDYN